MLSPFRSLWRNLRQRVRNWCVSDAIRSSSTERLWLALVPPCMIRWQGETIQVLHCEEHSTAEGPILRFECQTSRGREVLILRPGDLHQPPKMEWQ